MSIVALVTGSLGFFANNFPPETCERYHLVAPLAKCTLCSLGLYLTYLPVFAVLISQLIIFLRTYAISRNARWVLWTLSALFVVCLVPEFLGNVYKRIRERNRFRSCNDPNFNFSIALQDSRRNCTSGNIVKVAWIHYVAAM